MTAFESFMNITATILVIAVFVFVLWIIVKGIN